jgi:adenylate kinase
MKGSWARRSAARAARRASLGGPGTGKGTQAARLASGFGLVAISSGDALRKEIELGTELGRHVEEFVGSGRLAPDDVITQVMLGAVEKLPAGQGFILDGFPRTVPQAEALAAGLAARNGQIDAVISFEMPAQEIIERITSRRLCSNCKRTYNLRFFPPSRPGVCDSCGGKLMQRLDDHRDVIATRLQTYMELTHPLIEHYAGQGVLHRVNAAAEADAVEAELKGIVAKLRQTA